MSKRLSLASIVLALVVSAPLFAHHGGVTLYSDESVSMQGVVKVWYWANPHVLLSITATGDDGQAEDWVFEMQAPNTIHPAGFRKDTLKPGDAVMVEFQPVKNGNRNGRLLRLVRADGTELDPLSYRRGRSEAQ